MASSLDESYFLPDSSMEIDPQPSTSSSSNNNSEITPLKSRKLERYYYTHDPKNAKLDLAEKIGRFFLCLPFLIEL